MTKPVINREVARKVLETVDKGLIRGVGKPTPGSMCVEAAVCYALGLPHSDDPMCVGSAVRTFKIGLNDANWSCPAARAQGLRRVAIAQLGSDLIDQQKFVEELTLQITKQIVPIALRAVARLTPKYKASLEVAAAFCEALVEFAQVKLACNAARRAIAATGAATTATYDTTAAAYDVAANAIDAADTAVADAAYAYDVATSAAAQILLADATNATTTAAAHAANAADAVAAAYASCTAAATTVAIAAHAAMAKAANVAATAACDRVLTEAAEIAVQVLIKLNSPGVQWLDLCDE